MYRTISFIALLACIAWLAIDPGFEPFVGSLVALAAFFRDEVNGLIGKNFITLTPKSSLVRDFRNFKFSFTELEYINPRIIEDLDGWISDTGDQIASINITESNNSNRYFGDVKAKHIKGNPIVSWSNNEVSFAYKYVGCSFSGIHILQTWSSGRGTGAFCSVILVTISKDNAIKYKDGKPIKVERLIIKKIASIPLGDRYKGEIKYRFGILTIGVCKGMTSLRSKNEHMLII